MYLIFIHSFDCTILLTPYASIEIGCLAWSEITKLNTILGWIKEYYIIILQMENNELKVMVDREEHNFINQLLLYLPPQYIRKANHHNPYQVIIQAFYELSQQPKLDEEMNHLFKEIGADKKQWLKLQNSTERYDYLVKSLSNNIQQSSKKINGQIDQLINNQKKPLTMLKDASSKQKENYDWLCLKNRGSAFENKLKSKLIQAINESKNQKRIRQRINDPHNKSKVQLLNESLVIDEYEKFKIDYNWTEEDQDLLIHNINELKKKFNTTEFLKVCKRFKFISKHELQTLGSEQISRKIHQNNKIYLSRQFLLDKYYSTTECLTQKEQRFILKTSPLLSKCVDKNFIKTAIKNIEYQDISKIELKIAEDIINKFDQIRRIVKSSRKVYKQDQNNEIKNRIVEFQRKKQREIIRQIAREQLKKHRIDTHQPKKFLKHNLSAKILQTPLNQYHPSSGLFVKDCNQQCTDDLFNNYELHYLHKKSKNMLNQQASRNISTIHFYTGGLEENNIVISDQALRNLCFIIKAQYYEKTLKQNLQNYDIPSIQISKRTTTQSVFRTQTILQTDKKCKTIRKLTEEQPQESQIKKKILDSKEKAKGKIYISKLLSFAAENSYANFRSINMRLSGEQINTKDTKGNTALYYTCKHQNLQFITALLNLGADPSIFCEKQTTPLHFIFKTNNINLIVRCLCSSITPNLNALNSDNKTPLAYSTYEVLTKLNLQEGVLVVQNRSVDFDNNILLSKERTQRLADTYMWQNKAYS